MSDELEKYIQKNRDRFDDGAPSDQLWQKISDDLDRHDARKTGSKRALRVWQVAAAVLLLITGWLAMDKIQTNGRNEVAQETIPVEIKEVEAFYAQQISEKRQTMLALTENRPDLKEQFSDELNELDSAYSALKSDFGKGDPEEVTNAMIWNLQLRIEILNRQLEILKEIKTEVNDETII